MSEFVLLFRSTDSEHMERMGTPQRAQQSVEAWLAWVRASGELRIEPDPDPLPTIPPPTPGAVSPNDPPGGAQTPGQIPGVPPRRVVDAARRR
jgi:hypothetical protein